MLPLLAQTPSSVFSDSSQSRDDGGEPDQVTAGIARRLFVLLSACAPKNTSSQEWLLSLQSVTETFHRTADLAFRALVEELEPAQAMRADDARRTLVGQFLSDTRPGTLNLPAWRGIYGALERICGVLSTLQAFLVTPTPSPVAFPVGKIAEVLNRVLSILPPGAALDEFNSGSRVNLEVDKEEREALCGFLPRLHVLAIGTTALLLQRLEGYMAGPMYDLVGQVLWVFRAEKSHDTIREASYNLLSLFLSHFGFTMPRSMAPAMSECFKSCCEDLLPSGKIPNAVVSYGHQAAGPPNRNGVPSADVNSYFESGDQTLQMSCATRETRAAASAFLRTALRKLPRDYMTFRERAEIDRVSILIQDEKLMQASVMNHLLQKNDRHQSSILPFLARKFASSEHVEALIRPRMPVLQVRDRESVMLSNEDDESGDNVEGADHHKTADFTPLDYSLAYDENTKGGKRYPTATLSSNAPENLYSLPEADTRTPGSETALPEEAVSLTFPIKRANEASDEFGDQPLTTDEEQSAEHVSKRPRLVPEEVYAQPASSRELPSPPILPTNDDHASSSKGSPNKEPFPDLSAMDEVGEDDSSEESSIPSLDMTIYTDGEDEEDEEG